MGLMRPHRRRTTGSLHWVELPASNPAIRGNGRCLWASSDHGNKCTVEPAPATVRTPNLRHSAHCHQRYLENISLLQQLDSNATPPSSGHKKGRARCTQLAIGMRTRRRPGKRYLAMQTSALGKILVRWIQKPCIYGRKLSSCQPRLPLRLLFSNGSHSAKSAFPSSI